MISAVLISPCSGSPRLIDHLTCAVPRDTEPLETWCLETGFRSTIISFTAYPYDPYSNKSKVARHLVQFLRHNLYTAQHPPRGSRSFFPSIKLPRAYIQRYTTHSIAILPHPLPHHEHNTDTTYHFTAGVSLAKGRLLPSNQIVPSLAKTLNDSRMPDAEAVLSSRT